MAGLLVASWSEGAAPVVQAQFEIARSAFVRLKGSGCTADTTRAGMRIARFASSFSPYRSILERNGVLGAAAGWVYFQDRAVPPESFLDELTDRFLRDRERAFTGLQGHFLTVAADTGEVAVHGAVDRLGLFPAYTIETEHAAWLSTSSLVLAAALGLPMDPASVRALFVDGRIRAPRSGFQGVRRLQLGEEASLQRGRLTIRKTWRPVPIAARWLRIEDAAAEGSRLIEDTCRRATSYWPRWICDLTAGLDSRLVIAHLAHLAAPVHINVVGETGNIDVVIARQIAERFGWECHHISPPSSSGELRWPLFERAVALTDGEIPGHAFDGSLRQKVDYAQIFHAALGGGLGELLRDFFWQQEFWRVGRTPHIDLRRLLDYRFLFAKEPDLQLFDGNWRGEYISEQLQTIENLIENMATALNTTKLDIIYAWKQSGQAGRSVGAAFPVMAILNPLATSALFEFAISVPWRFRLHGRLVRHMIARASPRLAAMPTWYGGSAEPFAVMRPDVYVPFFIGYGQKLVRKLGQVTMRRSIFRDPTARHVPPAWNTGLVQVLRERGFLDAANLRTAHLYRAETLDRTFTEMREGRSRAFDRLFTIASIELVYRLRDEQAPAAGRAVPTPRRPTAA
jgi:hypothetical protein